MTTYSLAFASDLDAPRARVWSEVGTMRGVNAELGPWISMTAPPDAAAMRIDEAPTGQPLFSSWVLVRGVVPIDRHHFVLAEVDPGRGFVETSTSWSERRWEHRRRVEDRGEGACTLTDRLTFTPRVAGPLVARVVAAIFRHRHRVLRARFGGRAV